MNSEQPGRARRILIDREDAPQESWERGKGKDEHLWRDQITPGRGWMPSHELLERIRDAIGVEDLS
jgi:hypothetical protein